MGSPSSEKVEAGVKIGPVNYDNREHAFFTVLNDFTGGFGYKVLDIRDALGTYWFADPLNAPEFMTGRVTLSLQQTFVPIPNSSGVSHWEGGTNALWLERNSYYLFAVNQYLYRLSTLGGTPTFVVVFPNPVVSLVSAVDPTAGVQRLYAFLSAGVPYMSLDDGLTWVATFSKYVVSDNSANLIIGSLGDVLTQFNGKGSASFALLPGVTSGTKIVEPVSDGFAWDHKVLGVWQNTKIIFLVPCSEDCVLWRVPGASYVTGVIASAGGGSSNASIRWTVNGIADSTGSEMKEVLKQGEEPWNHLMDGDCNIIAAIDTNRALRFIGTGPAPWGEQAVYLRGGNKLYVLDFFGRKISPVDMGNNRAFIQGRVWNSDFVVTEGWDVFKYDPSGQTTQNIGLPRKWGVPPNLQNGASVAQIVDLIPYDDELFAIIVEPSEPATYLYRYNALGWHQVGRKMPNFFARAGFRATFPLNSGNQFSGRAQAIIIPGVQASANVPAAAGLPTGYWQFDLPVLSHSPTVGVDTFGTSGARWYTGWMDGGFFDLFGTLLRMDMDAFFHGGSILIEYRLDNDETTEATATWTPMVDIDGNPSAFDDDHLGLFFGNPDDPARGIKYRTVQFRITLIRGSDPNSSPEYRAATLVYLKTPEERTRWTFTIDVNRMLEASKSTLDQSYYIDGAAPTVETIWAKLKSLWVNEHVLVQLIIPNIEPDPGINVKIETKHMNIDDFRDAVAGQGWIQITALEPVA